MESFLRRINVKIFRSNVIRVFALPFLFATFTLVAGYKGALISFLTAPLVQSPLDTLQEVVDSPHTIGRFVFRINYGQMAFHLLIFSVGNVIKGDLHKSPEELYQRFDKKYSLYRNLNLTMDQAFQMASRRELIVFENRQMVEYRMRRDFTNEWVEN